METVKRGDWVQIGKVILNSGERAPQVPQDTQGVPLEMLAKGFLNQDSAGEGEEVEIKTVIGRKLRGKLLKNFPAYTHDFGQPQPELLPIAPELRQMLRGVVKDG